MIFNTAMYYTEESAIKIAIPIPTQTGSLFYNGEVQSPKWKNFNAKQVSITGDVTGTAEGTYTAIFSIIDKQAYVWEDGTDEDKYVDWVIGSRMYDWIEGRLSNLLKWKTVAYGASKYVCIADESNKYIYSSDGITWTEGTLPKTMNKPLIIYAAGKFVIITFSVNATSGIYNIYSIYSTDGINWQESQIGTGNSASRIYNIVYANNKFLFAYNIYAYSSTDGITWTYKYFPTNAYCYDIAYGNGLFVATTASQDNTVYFSIDGENWNSASVGWPSTGSAVLTRIAYGDGKFIIKTSSWNSSSDSYIAYSTNAISWTVVKDDVAFGYIGGLIFADGRFVDIRYKDTTLGSTGTSYFSEDGLNWNEATLPEGVSANCIAYGGNKFVVMDDGNYMFAYMETNHLVVPTQKGTLSYTGSAQSPVWEEYYSEKMTMTGQTTGTNVGSYTVTFTPKSGFYWTDGTSTGRSVTWKIDKAKVYIPYIEYSQFTYSGYATTPTISNFNANIMTLSGQTSETNAGNYSITVNLSNSNYEWIDGSTTAKELNWEILKADSTIALSTKKIYVETNNPVVSFNISSHTGGNTFTWSANTGNTKYIDVDISGTTVTVTAQKVTYSQEYVQFDLTIYNTGDENHISSFAKCAISYRVYSLPENPDTPPGPDTPPVIDIDVVKTTLEETTWEDIKTVSESGNGPNYWSVGDQKTISITDLPWDTDFPNISINAFIIGFDHNLSVESPGEHRIHFEFGKINDVLVSFTSNNYMDDYRNSSSNTTELIHINGKSKNSFWSGSIIRNRILGNDNNYTGSFLSSLPEDLVAVMKTVTKHSPYKFKNYGAQYVEGDDVTTDLLSLASATEYFGNTASDVAFVNTYQSQYQYYASGNGFHHYNCDDPESIVQTWTRTPVANHPDDNYSFVAIDDYTSGVAVDSDGGISLGISPIFFV